MKKIFLMLVAALMVGTATVNAQIWGGQLILRGGFAANNFKGDNTRGFDMLPGYNFSLDFNKNSLVQAQAGPQTKRLIPKGIEPLLVCRTSQI